MSEEYYWSTKARSYDGADYQFRIIPDSFKGVVLNRAKSEAGIQAPSGITFEVSNPRNVFPNEYFLGSDIVLDLVLSDGTEEYVARSFRFKVKAVESVYQKLYITCEDYISQYLEGDWPSSPLVDSLSPSSEDAPPDQLCVPMVFGQAFIPLRSVYITDQRYYVLGPDGPTYTIDSVQSPLEWGNTSTWDSASYSFNQSTQTINGSSYRVFQPIIADSDGDGAADAMGLWRKNGKFLDIPTKFSRSDTSTFTNPADIILFLLKEFGIPEDYLDELGSFADAATWYDTQGITFEGGFFFARPRREVLSEILTMANAALDFETQIKLRLLDTTSQATITKADVLRTGKGEGSFRYKAVAQRKIADAGYVEYQQSNKPQQKVVRAQVPARASIANMSSDVVSMRFLLDGEAAQKMGRLHYQRLYNKVASVSFTGPSKLLGLNPDMVITIDDPDYGGTYDVLIDQMTINRDLSIDFQCFRFDPGLENYGDYTPGSITVADDDSLFVWSEQLSGGYGSAAPADVSGLYAQSLSRGVKFDWQRNAEADVTHYKYQIKIENADATDDSGWLSYQTTTDTSVVRFLDQTEETTYGSDATIYIRVWAVNANSVQSENEAETSAQCLQAVAGQIIIHENGGLEADVSAYDGLVKISEGLTSAVPTTDYGEGLLALADITAAQEALGIPTDVGADLSGVIVAHNNVACHDGTVVELVSHGIEFAEPTEGLIHKYLLTDVGSGTAADSIGDNDGTVHSGTITTGPFGTSCWGGGPAGNYILLASEVSLISISFWGRRNDTSRTVYATKNNDNKGFISPSGGTGDNRLYYKNGIFSGIECDDLLWHHFAMVKDSTTIYFFYMDGVKDSSSKQVSTFGPPVMNAFGDNGVGSGAMDRVRIYNRRLTDDEVIVLALEPYLL